MILFFRKFLKGKRKGKWKERGGKLLLLMRKRNVMICRLRLSDSKMISRCTKTPIRRPLRTSSELMRTVSHS